ncbi:MAG: hypothetical protein F4155_01960 [Acidimicrobiales bacterium]|nr:hypothetical protein [Acidimicrobiaceae bacterium]MYA83399.1 hypothetical protein [Acidimicrobiales bacterium]MYH73546.1 hypothetical protein [Acidimicrobiales bacterium]MYK70167.1 hypothetical protein [Acidimicrobiales bacterium]
MSSPTFVAAVIAGTIFAAGVMLVIAAAASQAATAEARGRTAAMRQRLAAPSPKRAAELAAAGITPARLAVQRTIGLAVGIAVGIVAAGLWTAAAATAAALVALSSLIGWLLPAQAARDAAKRSRRELDGIIRLWIVLAAQQVTAGADPAAAMLNAARAGQRPTWNVLHRSLLAAQHERRPASDGLAELVDRYQLVGLTQAVSAFTLAVRRGTRLADTVLAAADNLWADSVARQREAAQRHNQIIALPATAIALALAAILIYPPLVSLTGGIVTTGP